ncbi:MAG: DUF2887 domain-containing protein [Cyanobium sp.]
MNTDRWYYRVFQSAPDLIRSLLPGSDAAANELSLDPAAPGDRHYRFQALELKKLSHRLDGVLWPRESTGCAETGSPEFPVVLLEEQMHPDPGFRHRLAAQSSRFLQKHPHVEHHRELGAAGFDAAGGFPGPEHAVEAVAKFFELQGLEAVVAIAGGGWVEAQRLGASG